MSPTNRKALWILVALLPVLAALWLLSPHTDSAAYMRFIDDREMLGIPNAGNVLSNLPFFVVGIWGLIGRRGLPASYGAPMRIFSLGLLLTAFGSSYFHWNPNPETLFWDRLPMTISFTAVLALVIGDRIDARFGLRSLWPLELAGVGTVVAWRYGWTDIRPYVLVQYGGLLAVFAILATCRHGRLANRELLAGLGFYAVAKALEVGDQAVYTATSGIVSGHSIKHVAAAVGAALVIRAVLRTDPSLPSEAV